MSAGEIRTGDVNWSVWIEGADDLDAVARAVIREQVIRDGMAETGESRQIVAETLDAAISMDHEAVTHLMDGEPTTLAAALSRYVEELETLPEGYDLTVAEVVGNLETLLAYPWPGPAGREDKDPCICRRDRGGLRYPASHPANLDRGIDCPVHPRSAGRA